MGVEHWYLTIFRVNMLKLLTTLVLSRGTYADIRTALEQVCEEAKNNGLELPTFCPGLRGVVFDGQMRLQSFDQYGCWCDISNGLTRRSNSGPVNELDAACKLLYHSYNCIQKDDSS